MDKPVLSQLQRNWLQEIGIDARMLAHFSAQPFAETTPAPQEPQAVAAAPMDAASTQPQPTQPAATATPRDKGSSPGAELIASLLKRTPLPVAPTPQRDVGAALPDAAVASESDSLQALRRQAEACQACGLHEVRGKLVFGEGAENAPQWMFIGEAPGEYDDTLGLPFKGRAGELLQAMLQSIGITEESPAYFTNVLKCRPMGNRSPEASEIASCMPLLRQQIRLLRPASLVALGRVSAGALLGTDGDLDTLRGQVHHYVDEDGRRIPVVVTHHPASLLLHGQLKAEAWRDLNLLAGLPAQP